MREATSRPWVLEDRVIYGPNGETIADVLDTTEGLEGGDPVADQNGELIVRAVNAFDDLVAALRAARKQMQNEWHNKPRIGMEAECAMADSAIAKATDIDTAATRG